MAIRSALLGVMLAAIGVALAGCASTGDITRGRTQEVLLQTDPPGATCTVVRNGAALATIYTPGAATIERRGEPIEVSCTRQGYLAHRESFVSENAAYVESDEGVDREPTPGEAAARDVAAGVSSTAIQLGASLGVAGAAVAAPILLVGLVAAPAYGIYQYANNPPYAIRRTPIMLLTPASFESPAEREAFFAYRIAQLQAYAEAELAQGKDKCSGGYCKYLFGKIESAHKARLDSLDADRLQTTIAARKGSDSP